MPFLPQAVPELTAAPASAVIAAVYLGTMLGEVPSIATVAGGLIIIVSIVVFGLKEK